MSHRPAKKTLTDLHRMKEQGAPAAWVTAYDVPFAHAAERAGLPVRMLSAVPDIDTPDDLDFLTFPLANLPADSRVRAWVASHLPPMGLAPISASPLCEEEASQGAR